MIVIGVVDGMTLLSRHCLHAWPDTPATGGLSSISRVIIIAKTLPAGRTRRSD
jgi:hypothetical protein